MKNEFSKEIRFFRTILQNQINSLMDPLRKEHSRLKALPPKCQEEYLIKMFGRRFYKTAHPELSPKSIGRAILEILTAISQSKQPRSISSKGPTTRLIEQAKEREQNLNSFIENLAAFIEHAPSIFVLDAVFRYAERKKFYDVATLDDTKGVGILSPSEMVTFLSELHAANQSLCNAFLEHWSKHYEITLFRDSFKAKETQSATEYLTGMHGGSSAFAIEVTSASKGLYNICSFVEAVDHCLESCRKIDQKYYVKWSDVLIPQPKELSNDYYSSTNHDRLNNSLAAKRHMFTINEFNAIVADEKDLSEEQVENMSNYASDTPVTRLDGSVHTETVKRELTGKDRANRPPLFAGEKGEDAFRRLHEKMNNIYFETTYENFAGLFRCIPQELDSGFYRPIKWLGKIRDLQYFIEALYRRNEDEPAPDLNKSGLSKIFSIMNEGKEQCDLDLGKNTLRCWGPQGKITPEDRQEKKIRTFFYQIMEVLQVSD